MSVMLRASKCQARLSITLVRDFLSCQKAIVSMLFTSALDITSLHVELLRSISKIVFRSDMARTACTMIGFLVQLRALPPSKVNSIQRFRTIAQSWALQDRARKIVFSLQNQILINTVCPGRLIRHRIARPAGLAFNLYRGSA